MKISVSSYSFHTVKDLSYIEMCDKAKEMGFDGIEFTEIVPETVENALEIKKHCDQIGLPIVAYSVGANFNCLFGQKRLIAQMKRHIAVASVLGVPVMRHDLCSRLYPWQTYEKVIEKIAPKIREISEYARSKGVMTLTENHGSVFQAPERMKKLMDTVACDNYRWLCDIGNFLCVGSEPLASVKTALPYVKHVHAKDFYVTDNPQKGSFPARSGKHLTGTIVGKGDVPVKECISALKESGYDGYYTLEFEGTEEVFFAVQEGLNYLRSL